MATFEAKVYRLQIETHPNADALELARVGDYLSIVRKGAFKTGDLGVYIPEQAVLPEWLIKALGLEGKLAGSAKNRVKAIKLRGVLSQGLIYPVVGEETSFPQTGGVGSTVSTYIQLVDGQYGVGEGDDVTDQLGIVKYDPPIPASMSGEVQATYGQTLKYDIENIKKYPNVLKLDEPVFITEKLHGTWACFGYHPELEAKVGNALVIGSKGLSAQGLSFKINEANMTSNLYVRTHFQYAEQFQHLKRALDERFGEGPFYLLGEIYGRGVQDLHYGEMHPRFRAFDLFVGDPSSGGYVGPLDKYAFIEQAGFESVPVLYRGPFDRAIVDEYTNGTEAVSGKSTNMREGVVITPMAERRDTEIGRVILKSVSEAYILRKDGTEFT